MKLGAVDRQLADRAVEIDVGNPPGALILAHQVVEFRCLAVGFDDLRLRHDVCAIGPLASDLQLLTRIGVELVGVSRGNIVRKGRCQLLLLSRVKGRPGRANSDPGHGWDGEGSVDRRRQPRIPPGLPEHSAILHIAEQDTVKIAHHHLRVRGRDRSLREQTD
jgi:hypothetical protein